MYFDGIIIGFIAFLTIGFFHPVIIYGEYHFGVKLWILFLFMGIISCILSLMFKNTIISSMFAIIGFCCFWSILELFHQKKRVEKGWFPKKEKKKIK
jgi:uncharacterized membrane protein YfhO